MASSTNTDTSSFFTSSTYLEQFFAPSKIIEDVGELSARLETPPSLLDVPTRILCVCDQNPTEKNMVLRQARTLERGKQKLQFAGKEGCIQIAREICAEFHGRGGAKPVQKIPRNEADPADLGNKVARAFARLSNIVWTRSDEDVDVEMLHLLRQYLEDCQAHFRCRLDARRQLALALARFVDQLISFHA